MKLLQTKTSVQTNLAVKTKKAPCGPRSSKRGCMHKAALETFPLWVGGRTEKHSVLFPRSQCAGHPINSFIQTITSCCTSRLDEPLPIPQSTESKLLGDFSSWHRIWQILLICKHQHNGFAHFLFIQHLVQLLSCILGPLSIIAVNYKNQTVGALEVVPPERADPVLPTHIPHCEADVFVLHGFHIEANCWDCCHHFPKFELVEDCGFTSCIQADHEDAHVCRSCKTVPQLCENQTHCLPKRTELKV